MSFLLPLWSFLWLKCGVSLPQTLTAFLRGISLNKETGSGGYILCLAVPGGSQGLSSGGWGSSFTKGRDQNAFSFLLQDDPEGAFVPPEFDLTGNTFEVSTSKW